MGKREVGELGIIDLLVSVMIAEFASMAIENYSRPLVETLVPTLVVVLLQLGLAFFSMKNSKVRKLVDANPSFIINEGKINFKEMEKQRYNLDDLLTQMRDKGIKSIDEIEYAILENSGKLSVFLNDNKKIYPMPLILDGEIQYETLSSIKKNKIWLLELLKSQGTTLDKVFYAFYKNNKCFIIKRNVE